jgi:hypothetical protein
VVAVVVVALVVVALEGGELRVVLVGRRVVVVARRVVEVVEASAPPGTTPR